MASSSRAVEEKQFKFNFRNVVNGEPDLQTRRDWVEQMGTPYPHEHVKQLFKRARERHEKRKAASAAGQAEVPDTPPRRAAKAARRPNVPLVTLTIDEEASDEGGGQATEERAGEGASENGSNEEETSNAEPTQQQLQQGKALKQMKIDALFQSPNARCCDTSLID